MPTLIKKSKNQANGFTLIEIMVAMVIGLLGILVIMQVFSLFEGQKRTTTGGGDAQSAGAIALYSIERDVRQSGWGFNTSDLLGCNLQIPSTTTLIPLGAVVINPPTTVIPLGDTNTDTLLVSYGTSNGASEGDIINAQNNNVYAVATSTSFRVNDYIIATPPLSTTTIRPAPCNLLLDHVIGIVSPNITGEAGGLPNFSTGRLYNMGAAPRILAYAIRNGGLTVCDYLVNDCGATGNLTVTSVWVPIGENIVSLRAQYGRDTTTPMNPTDFSVDTYDQTTPSATTGTNCDWLRISALQIVLVSRNSQPEKSAVTTAAVGNLPTWIGQTTAPIVLTATVVPNGFTWQNYRYKIFQTTIPMRNVVSATKPSSC